ncbi:MAG: hypothetical protein JRD89_11690 [Deltaproteobacteria bacterium]|nr:hypothetical protein [Deltaproteobacteria bacterium]
MAKKVTIRLHVPDKEDVVELLRELVGKFPMSIDIEKEEDKDGGADKEATGEGE